MSTRANSLRNLVLDSLYFAAVMSAFGALTTTFAAGAESTVTPLADVATDRRLTDDHIDSRLNTDDNMPSGDPTESAAAARETNILGMKLFEVRPGAVRVDDVTAASPAWDAGIRRGDQLLSIEGVKIRKLAPWVEDIARLLDDQKDGHAVAAQVKRNDEQLDLRIKLPVSRAAQARDARKADLAAAEAARKQAQGAGQPQQPGATIVNTDEGERDYYGPGYVGGGGLVGGGLVADGVTSGTADDRNPDRAIAQLVAMNTFGGGGRGQVGLATFQTSGSSVAANVVVRGLPQGSYVVGIDDGGGMVGAGAGVGPYGAGYDGVGLGYGDPNDPNWTGENGAVTDGRSNRNGNSRRDRINGSQTDRRMNDAQMQNRQNQQPMPGQTMPGQVSPNQQPPNQPMQQQQTPMPQQPLPQQPVGPAGGGASGGAPAGGDGASLANPNGPAYLGQQLDPAMNPASGPQRSQPAVPSAAGNQIQGNIQRNRNVDPRVNSPNNVPGNTNPGIGGAGQPGGPQFMRELGVLNIGPDGSGQVQTRLDGIQVRSLIGLSVTVASTASAGGNGVGQNGVNPVVTSAAANGADARTPQGRAAAAQAARNQSGPGIVATGVIQLAQGNAGFGLGGDNNEPNYNEPLDPATEQLRDRNFDASDLREDFDPSNPRQDFDPSNPRQTFDPSQGPANPEQQNFDPASQPGATGDQDFDPAQ